MEADMGQGRTSRVRSCCSCSEGTRELTASTPFSTTAHLRSTPLRPLSSALSSLGAAISATVSYIPPRRRALVAVTTTLILFILFFLRPHSHPPSNPKHTLAILQDSGKVDAIVDQTTGLHRGNNKAKVLEGFSNPYGFISLVDPCKFSSHVMRR